jgi:Tol biopolymer transport system component
MLPTATSAADATCAQTLKNAARAGTKILFDSDRDGNGEIYIMNLDGSGLTNLTQHLAEEWGHQWSPMGDKISFLSNRDGEPYLYVMNRDGSNPTRVTDIPTMEGYMWSPTGDKIAFVHESNNQRDIYVISQNGSGLVNLTQNPSDEWEFSWSPDGQKIAFVSNGDGDNEIYVIQSNGSGLTQLTHNNGNDEHPSWSPFYDQLVFTSDVKPGEVDPSSGGMKDQYLYVASSDGMTMTFLSSDPQLRFSYNPKWSPGGGRIVFADVENGPGFPSHVFIINGDGTGLIPIPEVSSGGRMNFAWSPNSLRIVVRYGNSGSASFAGSTIMVFNSDGTNPIKLESNSIFVSQPQWTHDSKFIIFESGSDEIDPQNDPFPLGYGINIIQVDGTCFTRLTATTFKDNNPLLSSP